MFKDDHLGLGMVISAVSHMPFNMTNISQEITLFLAPR